MTLTEAACASYNQTAAFNPLYYSYAAYCDEINLTQWDCKWCNAASNNFLIQSVITLDYLQAFIGLDQQHNRFVISFRGTHNPQDWIKNMEYGQVPYPNVKDGFVHRG